MTVDTDKTAAVDEERVKALESFLKTAPKQLGTRVARLSDDSHVDVAAISTGSLGLDHALGVGGIPRGRITELYGPTGGGKTTLALEAARRCQEEGGFIGFVDSEHALNRELVDTIGIDESRFVITQPDTGEDAAKAAYMMMDSGAFDMVIVDSAAAMVPKAEFEADIEQNFMGLQARLLSRFCRSAAPKAASSNVALVVINQVRVDLQSYGAPETSTGGKGLKFYSSVRIEVRTSANKQIKRGTDVVGTKVKATVKKNKFASPFRTAEYDIIFGRGIDASRDVFEVALKLGIIERSGNTYVVVMKGQGLEGCDEKLAVGRDKAAEALMDDPDLFLEVQEAARARLAGAEVDHQAREEDVAATYIHDAVAREPAAQGDDDPVDPSELPDPPVAPEGEPAQEESDEELFGLG